MVVVVVATAAAVVVARVVLVAAVGLVDDDDVAVVVGAATSSLYVGAYVGCVVAHACDAAGVVEIKGDSFPTSRPTKVASSFTLKNTWYYSNNLSGASEQNLTSRAHTIAIYTTNFNGNVAIEGNLDDTASTDDDDWFVIPIQGMGATQTQFTPASADPKIEPYQLNLISLSLYLNCPSKLLQSSFEAPVSRFLLAYMSRGRGVRICRSQSPISAV